MSFSKSLEKWDIACLLWQVPEPSLLIQSSLYFEMMLQVEHFCTFLFNSTTENDLSPELLPYLSFKYFQHKKTVSFFIVSDILRCMDTLSEVSDTHLLILWFHSVHFVSFFSSLLNIYRPLDQKFWGALLPNPSPALIGTPNGANYSKVSLCCIRESGFDPALMHLISIFNTHFYGSQGPNNFEALLPVSVSSAFSYFSYKSSISQCVDSGDAMQGSRVFSEYENPSCAAPPPRHALLQHTESPS